MHVPSVTPLPVVVVHKPRLLTATTRPVVPSGSLGRTERSRAHSGLGVVSRVPVGVDAEFHARRRPGERFTGSPGFLLSLLRALMHLWLGSSDQRIGEGTGRSSPSPRKGTPGASKRSAWGGVSLWA